MIVSLLSQNITIVKYNKNECIVDIQYELLFNINYNFTLNGSF